MHKFITLIHLIHSYFIFLLVNDGCKVFVLSNALLLIKDFKRFFTASSAFKK